MELGSHAKCGVEGVGTVKFHLKLGGSLEVEDMSYVLELKMNLFFSLEMDDSGYAISLEYGWVLIQLKGSDIDLA